MPNRIQYPAVSAPLFTPSPPETVTVDKWWMAPPDLRSPVPRQQSKAGVEPLPTFGEVVLFDKWWRDQADQKRFIGRPRGEGTEAPLQPILPPPTPFDWQRAEARQAPARRFPQSGDVFAPIVTVNTPEVITVDQWFMQPARQRPAPPRQIWVAEVFFIDGLPLPPIPICCPPHLRPDEGPTFHVTTDSQATFHGRADEAPAARMAPPHCSNERRSP
jgi:hypothetical protein